VVIQLSERIQSSGRLQQRPRSDYQQLQRTGIQGQLTSQKQPHRVLVDHAILAQSELLGWQINGEIWPVREVRRIICNGLLMSATGTPKFTFRTVENSALNFIPIRSLILNVFPSAVSHSRSPQLG